MPNQKQKDGKTQLAFIIAAAAAALLLSIPAVEASGLHTTVVEEQEQEDELQDIIDFTTLFLDGKDKEIGRLEFTPRWSSVIWLDPNSLHVVFADCLPGEFALSGQKILQDYSLQVIESHAIAMPGDSMSWFFVINNTNAFERLPVAAGVICVSDSDVDEDESERTAILRPEVNQKIHLIVKNIAIVDDRDIDIQQIINIKYVINQIAIQVAIAGGNITQIINQLAGQTADIGEQKVVVEQFIGQLANQSAQGDLASVNQTINQLARQTAMSEDNETLDISQLIEEQHVQQNTTGNGQQTSNNDIEEEEEEQQDEVQIASGLIEGTEEDDRLEGTEQDDEIRGLGGDDQIYGFSGNDMLDGGHGSNYMEGGSGDDVITADGDRLDEATWGNNEVIAGDGDDTIELTQTSGSIMAGDGDDVITAVAESGTVDEFFIEGGEGDDLVDVSDTHATIDGGSGNDEIHAGGETGHAVYGGSDDDQLYLETDIGGQLFGEDGNDYLWSQFGGTLDGGNGNDTIESSGMNDFFTFIGGSGADHFICTSGDEETIQDFDAQEGDTTTGECDNL